MRLLPYVPFMLAVTMALSCELGALAQASATAPLKSGAVLVYVGTYTGPKSQGIYLCRLDPQTGTLTSLGLAGETEHPSFLAFHPNHRFLYAVNEIGQFSGKPGGAVTGFIVDSQSGRLTRLNQQPTGGAHPCHLVVDRTGKSILVANYSGGSVTVLPIQSDGRLGEATSFIQHQGSSVNRQRQAGPHAHGIYLDATNRFAFVPDLGLDKVMIYRFSAAKGTIEANDPAWATLKPGAGPRHLALHPQGHYVYVINELDSTVTAFSYNAERGALNEVQTVSTLPDKFEGENTTAEVVVHPNGKFLYGSNRGHDSIAVFAIEAATGKVSLVEHQSTRGKAPRNFGIDPSGTWLLAANQDSDRVAVFRIDPTTGRLSPTGQPVEVPSPVCLTFMVRNPPGNPTP